MRRWRKMEEGLEITIYLPGLTLPLSSFSKMIWRSTLNLPERGLYLMVSTALNSGPGAWVK